MSRLAHYRPAYGKLDTHGVLLRSEFSIDLWDVDSFDWLYAGQLDSIPDLAHLVGTDIRLGSFDTWKFQLLEDHITDFL